MRSGFAAAIAWWTAPNADLPLALTRIALGLLLLSTEIHFLAMFDTYFGGDGIAPRSEWIATDPAFALNLFRWIPSDRWAFAVGVIGLLPACLFCVGLFPRAAAACSWYLLASYHDRAPLILSGGDTLLRLMLFLFLFARSDRRLALGVFRRASAPTDSWPLRLMQVQIALIYLASGLHKLQGETWPRGEAVSYALRLATFNRADWSWIVSHGSICNLLTYFTLGIELTAPLLLWFRATRAWVLFALLLLHLGIETLMYIPMFEWVALASLIVFVDPSSAETFVKRLREFLVRSVRRPLFR